MSLSLIPLHVRILSRRLGLLEDRYSTPKIVDSAHDNEYLSEKYQYTPVPSDEKELPVSQSPSRRAVLNGVYILINLVSALCLTFLNKIVVSNDQLSGCMVSYAAYNFASTFLVLGIASLPPFNLFQRKRASILAVLPLCILFGGFLLLGNLSLEYNDMAFYSLARLMTCPTVVLLQYLLFRNTISRAKLISVMLLTSGVVLANGHFGLSNTFGLFLAVASFVVTAAYQVLIGRSVATLSLTPPQLLFNQAPITALLLLSIAPFLDTRPHFVAIPADVWVAVVATGLIAPIFSISQFLIIGNTSALTFNVMGLAKTIGNLTISWTIAGRFPSAIEIIGVTTAMSGMWLYAACSAAPRPQFDARVEPIRGSAYEDDLESASSASSSPRLEEWIEKKKIGVLVNVTEVDGKV